MAKMYVLTHPDGENKDKDVSVSLATAIKLLKGKSMSKKWKLKDTKLKIVPKDKSFEIVAV